MRKTVEIVLCFLLFTASAFAQNGASASKTAIQCRPIDGSTTPIQADEKVIGDQFCRAVPVQKPAPAPTQTQVTPTTAPTAPTAPENLASRGYVVASVAHTAAAQSQPAQSATSSAPASVEVMPNSVFIAPMNGFENYLAAAFDKKKVPLTVVADQTRAAYVITGTAEEKKPGAMKMLVFGQIHADNAASIQMIDQKTGAVVFAYAVNKKNTLHGDQTTAEACAKHLKEKLEKK